ncbi:hypothetical protein CG747_13430 [Streptomyces sp. CB02959]|nr:hypothetical protein CG747_13430 [Streptomyces sp. CB02959]
MLRSGCRWRMLPRDLMPWYAAHRWFTKWPRAAPGTASTTSSAARSGASGAAPSVARSAGAWAARRPRLRQAAEDFARARCTSLYSVPDAGDASRCAFVDRLHDQTMYLEKVPTRRTRSSPPGQSLPAVRSSHGPSRLVRRNQPAGSPNQRESWSSRSRWSSPIQATWPSGRSRTHGTSSAAVGSAR